MKPEEEILNYEQLNAIKLEMEGKLPELAKLNLEIGRQKQVERILKEMKEEDK